jgi:cell division protein FtsA
MRRSAPAFPPIACLEVGTSHARLVVAECLPEGTLSLLGAGIVPSRGVSKAEIVDFDQALSAVRAALRQAEASADIAIHQVHLLVTGGHIRSAVNRGTAPVLSTERVVGPAEIEDVMTNARALSLPHDREVLHTIGQSFTVDDQAGVLNPEGMEASRLAADVLIIHGVRNRLRNAVRVAEEAGVEVVDTVFSGLCSALAVLTVEQKEAGALVIDLGAGASEFVVYARKSIAHAGVLAVGGDHVTNDIAVGLNLPYPVAEKLKCLHGAALVDLGRRSEIHTVPAEAGFEARQVRRHDLNQIIHARLEELFQLIRAEVDARRLRHLLGAGVVLTGGGVHLAETQALAARVFDLPCAVAAATGVAGLTDLAARPDCAAPIGLLRYVQRNLQREPEEASGGNRVGRWLRDMLGRGNRHVG